MKKVLYILMISILVFTGVLTSCGSSSVDDEFLKDMASGLEDRWDIANASEELENEEELVNAELNKIEKYKDSEFENKDLEELATQYIEMLEQQKEAIIYETSDFEKYLTLWEEAYNKRSTLITEINEKYGIPVSDKYEDDLKGLLNNARGVAKVEELENQLNDMSNSGNFEKSDCTLTVENTTDIDFSYFEVNINFLDKDGAVVDSRMDDVNNWKSGHVAKFQFYVDSDFDDYEISAGYYEEE